MLGTQKNIVLIGGGGHCKSCIDVIRATGKYHIIGILDVPEVLGKKVSGIEIIGNDADYLKFHRQGFSFLITVGQIEKAVIRKKIFDELSSINATIETIVAPTAYVSKEATLGPGTIIMHKAFVNAGAVVGRNNIINTGAVIEHDAETGQHNHISTGVLINGDCKLGDGNFIGSGVTIKNAIQIGNEIIIGAGSVVIRNLEAKGIYVGNPAKKIK